MMAQIVGPSCIPQDPWFTSISMSLLLTFERKVQESVFYINCDSDNDIDHDDGDPGVP